MTNTNGLPTKTQITALIATCLDAGYNEAAGLLTLASESISENVKRDTAEDEVSRKLDQMITDVQEATANLREANEINTRMVDGATAILLKMQDNPDHRTNETRGAYSDDEIKADYRERADLRSMAGGC